MEVRVGVREGFGRLREGFGRGSGGVEEAPGGSRRVRGRSEYKVCHRHGSLGSPHINQSLEQSTQDGRTKNKEQGTRNKV